MLDIRYGYSIVEYEGDGSTTQFQVPFPFIDRFNVFVTLYDGEDAVDGPQSTYGWVNDGMIEYTIPPATGLIVRIERRSSSLGELVNFADGATITERDLDLAYKQGYYVAQEAMDIAGIVLNSTSDLAGDVASAAASATAAALSAAAAAASAASVGGIIATAQGFANDAAASAVLAAASATSAANAASAAVNGKMDKASNLSDVADVPTSRTNLGLGTGDSPAFTKVIVGAGSNVAPAIAFPNWGTGTGSGFTQPGNAAIGVVLGTAERARFLSVSAGGAMHVLASTAAYVGFGNSSGGVQAAFMFDADDNIGQRRGANPQSFRVYNTYTDASNYERLAISWQTNRMVIAPEKAGTGVARALDLGGPSTSSLTFNGGGAAWQWAVQAAGHFIANSDNAYDIGASAANRPRSLYAGTSFIAPDTAANVPSFNWASSLTSGFRWNSTGTGIDMIVTGSTVFFANNGHFRLRAACPLEWSSGNPETAAGDLFLQRDAANVLAQRNGANAQTSRLYNTYTDASNYERLSIGFTGGLAIIRPESAGTGANKDLYIGGGVTGGLIVQTNGGNSRWIYQSAGNLIAAVDNTYDLGASGASRPRTGYFGTSVVSPQVSSSKYEETSYQSPGIVAGNVTIDCSLGNTFVVSVAVPITGFTFSNVPASGKAYDCRIILVSDGNARAVAYPASVSWGTNVPVSATDATLNKEAHVLLHTRDGGTSWKAANGGNNY